MNCVTIESPRRPAPLRPLALLAAIALLASLSAGCLFAKNTTPKGVNVPFGKVEPGWGVRRTQEVVGAPDDYGEDYRGTSVLGILTVIPLIVWDLPLWMNGTDRITTLYYENQGRIILTRDKRVRQVLYDPDEDGYR